MLAFAVFVWDEDGITAVDAELRDGALNGRTNTRTWRSPNWSAVRNNCALPPILVGT
jgi:uncharacterized lipoprotein NlpE involved in copper resistance